MNMEALRQILAIFKVDNASLKKGITEGNKLVDQLKDGLNSLIGPLTAAFGGAAIVGFANDLIATADATAKTADALGLGIKELQEWQHAAGLSGVATEQVTTSITKLGQKIAQAKSGNAELAKTFKALDLDMDALAETADRSLGDAFQMVGLALAGVEDKAQRTDLAMKLFEESGPKLFNLFKGGADAIDAMRREVTELGIAFEDDFARSAEGFNDNLDRLGKAGKGFLLQVLEPIMPSLVEFTELMVRGAKAAIPLVKQFVLFTKNSQLLTASIGMLGGKALLLGIANFGKFAGILRVATAAAFRFLLPLLLLEDLIVFLAGGKSKLGEKLDKWFGEGTADKVRASVKELSDEVVGLFERFRDEVLPELKKFASEVEQKFRDITEGVVNFGQEWGPSILKVVAALGAAVVAFKATSAAMVLWQAATAGATAAMSAYTAATVLWSLKAPLMAMMFGKLRVAAAAFNATLLANPVALVVALIVGSLALVVAFWPQISEAAAKAWERIKQGGAKVSEWISGAWLELKFGALRLTAAVSDAFGGMWNNILAGAKTALGKVAGLLEKVPLIGGSASEGLKELAGGVNDLKMGTDASKVVKEQLEQARLALKAEIEAKQGRTGSSSEPVPQYYAAPQPNVTTNVTQDVNNTTEVHVTVPPGTPETLANRVGSAAQRGAQQGTKRNLRATQDALVPRPVG